MGDHRKLKTYKKKPKELKRSRPIGAEHILQLSGEGGNVGDLAHQTPEQHQGQVATSSRLQPTVFAGLAESNVDGGADSGHASTMGRKVHRGDKDTTGKKSGPTKERWLLTRKTWKYMQQAGRRLIPDGAQNRAEDVPKLEEFFQQVCRSEQKFIIWSRKSSYPGAIAASRKLKRRIRPSVRHRSKASSADEAETDEYKEYDRRAAMVIRLLHSYLNISEQDKRQPERSSESQIPTTVPGATSEPSTSRSSYSSVSVTTSSYGSQQRSPTSSDQQGESDLSKRTAELLESLRLYSQAAHRPIIPPEHITTDLLHNKTLLKKIYNDLKRQQLSLVLNRHTAASTNNLSHASSLTSLFSFRRDQPKTSPTSSLNVKLRSTGGATNLSGPDGNKDTFTGDKGFQLPKEKYIRPTNQLVPFISVVKPAKTFTTQGMQTDFLQLHEINNLRKDYETRKKELELLNQAPEEEADFTSRSHSRRKSSVDNEDVSQSVSDTIKRYLRMARKKSVNDDAANRFKRVNYDRNLRNIRAKGEINPPGMDEGNSKATQTLDAWPLLHYNNIRGIDCDILLEEAHSDWNNALQQRKQQHEEYLQQQQKDASKGNLSGTGSVPPPPGQQGTMGAPGGLPAAGAGAGGLFHSAQQQPQSSQSTQQQKYSPSQYQQQEHLSASANSSGGSQGLTSAMQKSKSSSNVGQFVSKKIWKSRSKSQSRIPATNKPQWAPQGNCIWMSPSGKRVVLSDGRLRDLSEIERKILHRVAIEKINQLNIGVNVTVPGDISSSTSSKSQKRRPLLIKRKALTTSIFDTGKKDENKVNGGGLVFGVSIEKCVDNDRLHKNGGVSGGGGGGSDRGSRNSIISLLGGGSHNKVGSCESLPSRSTNILGQYDDSGGGGGTGGGGCRNSFINTATMKMSRSQTDVRRGSQDEDDLLGHDAPNMAGTEPNSGQQVPALVLECIKHIEEHGLHTVGIFRVSTSKKRVRQLKEGFDRGEITSIDADICPHDVATILKEYLRDLPEPLLCRSLYKAFVKTQKIRNRRLQLEALSHLIQLLPVAHRDTLYVLLRFLAKIVRSSDDVTSNDTVITGNKMDSNNLATVIAPNILRSTEPGRSNTTEQEIDEQIDVINVIRTMIDHYEELFRIPAELMDEIYTNMMDTYPEQLDYLCERRDIAERYDDDMDSASSSTPLSSPPPVPILKHTSFPQHSVAFEESGPGAPNDKNITNRPIYSRDDFLHENTIKGGDPNGNAATQRRERTSRMKYIESEHELTRRRRRERNLSESGTGAGTPSPTKTTFNSSSTNWIPFSVESRNSTGDSGIQQYQQQQTVNQTQQGQFQQQQSAQSRRLFPPYGDQDGAGVVTASLKIPVQMQQSQQQQNPRNQANMCDTTNSGHIDLSDIPYIEDNGCGQDILTGSLHFGRGSGAVTTGTTTYQIPITIEGRTTSSSSTMSDQSRSSTMHQYNTDETSSAASSRRSSDNTSIILQKYPSALASQQQGTQPKRPDSLKRSSGRKQSNNIPTSGSGTTGENSPSGVPVLSPTTLIGQFGSLQAAHHHHPNAEPKLTPSISSIGGAVLRSKTADFERILKQNKKSKSGDTTSTAVEEFITGSTSVSSSSAGTIATSTGSGTAEDSSRPEKTARSRQQQTVSPAGPIYKRQELISSAQRTSK
ncbi:unnamed protein product [Hermetia illucens]|uniref:Rho-GAP domain-containing protein n=1 Tax=Hermetia illucens TaxID=343691 RepID=A0A7R8V9E8_HERIL|nr:uncharacterized protein LOC119660885 isoform X2 [Hermetia illucens]CAD7093970.1 unnamed protein product [Hermetia illucens]